jgi:hypothetical protein
MITKEIMLQFDGVGPKDWEYNQWEEAISCASNFGEDFLLENIELVLASKEGYGDGPDWKAVLYLKTEQFVFITAGCAYSGFDVYGQGHCYIENSAEELKKKIPLDELDELPYNTWLTVEEAIIKNIIQ